MQVQGNLGRYEGKSVSQLLKILQKHFNEYIRLRDRIKGTNIVKCASCGKTHEIGRASIDAGHLFSVSHARSLRFDERNVYAICTQCNRFNENHVLYLAERCKRLYGEKAYEEMYIKSKRDSAPNWFPFELVELIEKYIEKNKKLKAEHPTPAMIEKERMKQLKKKK